MAEDGLDVGDVGAPPPYQSLHEAIVRQDRRGVAWFLQRQADAVVHRDDDLRTPLLLAAAGGDCTTCTLLIRRMATYDADAINWPDAGGLTPLHWACTQQRVDAVALLLRHSASTTASDEDDRQPLHVAAFSGNARTVSLLLPHVPPDGLNAPSGDGLTPMHYAALSGSTSVVKLLIDAHAELDALDEERRTALSWAAGEGHEGTVVALLQARADVSLVDANGLGALHHAVKAAALGCARALLQHGASALQRTAGGELPEELARRCAGGGGGGGDAQLAAALVALLGGAAEAEALTRQQELIEQEAAAAKTPRNNRKKNKKQKEKRGGGGGGGGGGAAPLSARRSGGGGGGGGGESDDDDEPNDDDAADEALDELVAQRRARDQPPGRPAQPQPQPQQPQQQQLYPQQAPQTPPSSSQGAESTPTTPRDSLLDTRPRMPGPMAESARVRAQARASALPSLPSLPPLNVALAQRMHGVHPALPAPPSTRGQPPAPAAAAAASAVTSIAPATTDALKPTPPPLFSPEAASARRAPRSTARPHHPNAGAASTSALHADGMGRWHPAHVAAHAAEGPPPPPNPRASPNTPRPAMAAPRRTVESGGATSRPHPDAAPPPQQLQPPLSLPPGGGAEWPSRQLATPHSVSVWVQHASSEQRRALSTLIAQLSRGEAVAERAAAAAAAAERATVSHTDSTPRALDTPRGDAAQPPQPPNPAARGGHLDAAAWPPGALLLQPPPPPPPQPAEGAEQRVGRLRLRTDQLLGRGRSGTVVVCGNYEGKRAAVKIVPKRTGSRGGSSGGGGAAAAAELLAAREAELMDLCENENSHPNVLRLFGCEESAGAFYLAQELCVASLADLVAAAREPGRMGSRRRALLGRLGLSPPPLQSPSLHPALRRMLQQLLDGLCHLHRLDILHCKLRPSSVLVNGHGILKLSGLGLGRVGSSAARADSRQGTRSAYAADGFDPAEVLQLAGGAGGGAGGAGGPAGGGGSCEAHDLLPLQSKKAADVFSCGVLVFWTLTYGQHPYSRPDGGDKAAQRTANILRGDAVGLGALARLPEAQQLVGAMLAARPEQRLSAEQARQHPALWSDDEKLLFVRCVADEPQLTDDGCPLVCALEASGGALFGGDWCAKMHAELMASLQAHRSYQRGSVRELLRAVRNCDHMQGMPAEVQRLLLPRPSGIAAYFLPRFPALFWTLYNLVSEHWRAKRVFEPFFAWQLMQPGRRPTPATVTPPTSDQFGASRGL